jgi:hypothetical protein
MDVLQQDLGAAWLSFGGWGDHKEVLERSTCPKPSKASSLSGQLTNKTMAGSSNTSVRDEKGLKMGNGDMRVHKADLAKDRKNCAMEVYQGTDQAGEGSAAKEGVLEFDLDEEAEHACKYLAIAVYYSRKSYNPQALFADMLAAWRIQNLSSLEKIGDYNFRLEFAKEDEKRRAIEGGSWRHKGDALIVVHYDRLSRPSEV